MTLTYRILKEQLDLLSDEQLNDEVAIYENETESYVFIDDFEFADEDDDILQSGHLILVILDLN